MLGFKNISRIFATPIGGIPMGLNNLKNLKNASKN